ncbi:hypothetical protein TNCV_194951 [Trichonephila clavipes]|uniref:Uncharacterized protein n=1 Tax=Trichonephila clavipes TaxID=2585209 RepID=A0A8X7BM39_TRICX|nr:hypothetical protein TNCV_194951 [Trichonephila clavipes]
MQIKDGKKKISVPVQRTSKLVVASFRQPVRYEILTKATLLSFEIVPSHNYSPLKSAIHVQKTLQELFFWDGVQKPRRVSLDGSRQYR